MPPKKSKDGKKKKKTELSKTGEPAYTICARFLKIYEKECQTAGCLVFPAIKSALQKSVEDEKFLRKLVIEPQPINSPDDPVVLIEPLLTAMRKERYNYIKALYIWDLPLTNKEITALALLLEKSIYDIPVVDLMDNMIEVYGMRRLSKALPACPALTTLSLDYNEFGDEGCKHLVEGLSGNETLFSLSMNYCGLTALSAPGLSRIIATTCIRDLYLDGNDFGCLGAQKLITPVVEKAEQQIREIKAAEAAKLAAEEEQKRMLEESKSNRFNTLASSSPPASPVPPAATPSKTDGKKKVKKRGKKGKKEPPPPPTPGAYIYKLHLADNGIDTMDQSLDELQAIQCIRTFRRLIAASDTLQELDLEDNLIGDVGGCELIEGLLERKEINSLPGIKLRTTHRMKEQTLKELIKLGSGAVKKKKGKGKKKKK